MPGTANRDLASTELWQESLERSQRRRVLAADARKDQARKKTASFAVSAAVAASPMWPSVTATADDLSKDEAGKLARKLKHNHAEHVLLAYGDQSSAVAELQRALGIADDGIFGPKTRAAVVAFQKAHGLLPTGKVDVKTWLKLFPTDMIIYAPPGSASALGVNDTDEPEWAAISADAAGAPAGQGAGANAAADTANAAAHRATAAHIATAAHSAKGARSKSANARVPGAGHPSVHAAKMGATGPAVTIGPNTGGPRGGGGGGVPGVLGGLVAPGGGAGGGGGGSFHFPPLSSFGSAKEMIAAMIRMANRIDRHHYAYRWGGGHNSRFSGPYDCSGAVSAVLHAAGLLSRPMVSGEFMHWGAPHRGAVTIYANAGHVYMSILGRFFGTTHANPGGGAGWFKGAPRRGFAVVHVPFSKLHFKGTKHKRPKKKRTRKHRRHRRGPLNQLATTAPPSMTGGVAAPQSSPPPPSSPQPIATSASSQAPSSPSPAQIAVTGQQATPTPNPQPATTVQQYAPAPQAPAAAPAPQAPATPAPEAPAATPAPAAPAAPPAAGNESVSGSPDPNAPARTDTPASSPGAGSGAGTPSAPEAPVAEPSPQQPAPPPAAPAEQPVTETGQQAEQPPAAAPPPEPAPNEQSGSPDAQSQEGSGSGSPN